MEKEKDNSKLHRKPEEGTYSERELEPHENEVRIKTHEEGNRTIFPKTQVLEKTFENKLKKKKLTHVNVSPSQPSEGQLVTLSYHVAGKEHCCGGDWRIPGET